MTVLRLLELTKRLLPVATEIDDALLLMWLSNCENSILTDVLLASPENCTEITELNDAPLLVPHPFDKLYLPYMEAQICFANQEFDRYANFLQLYNAYVQEYNRWICETADPKQGQALQRGYYLSAYAIAVEHGYHGSVEDWLASLKGERGEKGDKGEKGEKGDTGEVEIDVTEEYESWKAQAVGNTSVSAFFRSDEIRVPGAYVVYTTDGIWKLRYTAASDRDEPLVWRWIMRYTEDGIFVAELYRNEKLVVYIDPNKGVYQAYEKELALREDLQPYGDSIERLQKSVAALEGRCCSVSGMLMNSPAGSTLYQGAVTAGTLPEIQTGGKPAGVNTQIVFTPSGANTFPPKLMLQGQAIEIRRRAYPDLNGATEALPAKSLLPGVPYTLTFSGQYWLLDSYVPLADSERNVTELCQAWLSSNSGTVKDFFLSGEISEPGTYVVYAAGYTWRMRYTVASGGDGSSIWRWIVYYTEDGFFAASLYCNKKLVIDFDPDSGIYKVYDDALALKSEIGTGGAREPYTEIEKFAQRPMRLNRILRIQLHGLEPFDDGHLRLALWRCDRKYARHKWVPARKVSDIEDHSLGYSRIRGKYGSSGTSGPDYPSTPAWMPNSGLAESFYSIYAEDGSLLPYVDIPLDSFVLPLVKPVGVLPDKSGWSGDPWDTCGVVGTDKTGGFLRFRFDVEKEDGTVLARCRNTLKVGAKNVLLQTPSVGLLKAAEPGSSSRRADLKNWYIRVE